MKKIMALVAVAVAAVAMASADPVLIGHGYWGSGLGTAVRTADGDKIDGTKWNFASNMEFGAGLAVNIPFGGYFGVQPGVDFYVNNVGLNWKLGSADLDVTYSYMSIDIPVLFTVKLNKWNFAVGPYVSIPVGDVVLAAKGNNDAGKLAAAGMDGDKYNHSWGSVGALISVGYEQRLGMGMLTYGARYMHDFMPITITNKTTKLDSGKSWRGSLAVDIGYKVPLSFFGL